MSRAFSEHRPPTESVNKVVLTDSRRHDGRLEHPTFRLGGAEQADHHANLLIDRALSFSRGETFRCMYGIVGVWSCFRMHIPRGDGGRRCYDGFATSGSPGVGVAVCVRWSLTYVSGRSSAVLSPSATRCCSHGLATRCASSPDQGFRSK